MIVIGSETSTASQKSIKSQQTFSIVDCKLVKGVKPGRKKTSLYGANNAVKSIINVNFLSVLNLVLNFKVLRLE